MLLTGLGRMEGCGRGGRKEGYTGNTTELFSWIFLFKKRKTKTLTCIHNRANENKEGFWIFSAGDGLGES